MKMPIVTVGKTSSLPKRRSSQIKKHSVLGIITV